MKLTLDDIRLIFRRANYKKKPEKGTFQILACNDFKFDDKNYILEYYILNIKQDCFQTAVEEFLLSNLYASVRHCALKNGLSSEIQVQCNEQ